MSALARREKAEDTGLRLFSFVKNRTRPLRDAGVDGLEDDLFLFIFLFIATLSFLLLPALFFR